MNNILAKNCIQLRNNVDNSIWIDQQIGVLQGDPLSPLLFNVLVQDVVQAVCGDTSVGMLLYADDMAIYSRSRGDLQRAVNAIADWASENQLIINTRKTEMMIFRKGGRLSSEDKITCNGEIINITNCFRYLGMSLQPTLLQEDPFGYM